MKNLLSSISITLGLITMTHAASFNAPGKDFLLIKGGFFTMGSPESEDWREITGKNLRSAYRAAMPQNKNRQKKMGRV